MGAPTHPGPDSSIRETLGGGVGLHGSDQTLGHVGDLGPDT